MTDYTTSDLVIIFGSGFIFVTLGLAFLAAKAMGVI